MGVGFMSKVCFPSAEEEAVDTIIDDITTPTETQSRISQWVVYAAQETERQRLQGTIIMQLEEKGKQYIGEEPKTPLRPLQYRLQHQEGPKKDCLHCQEEIENLLPEGF